MSLIYLHLSDIHFGQEKGGILFTHNDVRERVVDDVRLFVKSKFGRGVDGIIVSGDLAYGGSTTEYQVAARWLDRLTVAAGCPLTAIQVVPGNHDINRDGICKSTKRMLEEIASKGESELDSYLEHPKDREVFYGRFDDYRAFAEGYDCPLAGSLAAAITKLATLGYREHEIADISVSDSMSSLLTNSGPTPSLSSRCLKDYCSSTAEMEVRSTVSS